MQKGHEIKNDVYMRTSFSIRLLRYFLPCATRDSRIPEPIAVLGYQARILTGSSSTLNFFSIIQPMMRKMSGIFSGGSINGFISVLIMLDKK